MAVRKTKKGSWFIDRYVDGKRNRKVMPEVRTKSEALKAETVFVNQLFKRKYDPEVKRKLFAAYVKENFLPYSKLNKLSYYDDVLMTRVMCVFFKGKYLDEIPPAMIEDYKRHRLEGRTKKGTRRASATVNREMNTLRRIFSLALNDDFISENPCRKVKRLRADDGRTRYLSADEEARLMAALELPFPGDETGTF